jgi:hypothetical protein
LANALIPLVVGFALTTVLGGFLGSWLQQRAWDHQKKAQLREDALRRADIVCQQVSKLLDKRLYRMLRFYQALASDTETQDRVNRVQDCLREYDAVLYEWNDNLNVNLAFIGTYFGKRPAIGLTARSMRTISRSALISRATTGGAREAFLPTSAWTRSKQISIH